MAVSSQDQQLPALDAAENGRRGELGGIGLRRSAARGTIVNGIYLAGLNGLNLLKGFIAAAFLTTGEFGVWGVLSITLVAFLSIKQAGISDKYIQQDEPDQKLAFQRAFTYELMFAGVLVGVMALAVPLLALGYDQSDFIAPGLVLALGLPAVALQSPVWVFYRRMQFVRQRTLQAVDPIVTFALSVGLAIAGLGYWSLVIGAVCGSWAAAIVALRASPYPLAIRYEGGHLREYFSFSWPILFGSISALIMAQASLLAGNAKLGIGAAGAIYLAAQISFFAAKLDEVISQTLYPAICAVRDRADLLLETFLKSNRMAMLWAIPFGAGVAIFTTDLIQFGIGEKWRPAETLIEVFALILAANQLGFNWNLYFQAQGNTKPLAVGAAAPLIATGAIAIPLLLSDGLNGFAIGMAIVTGIQILVRLFFLRRLFPLSQILANAGRALAPTLPAAAIVLGLRAAAGEPATAVASLAEVALFMAIAIGATLVLERRLLREVLGYLGRRAEAPVAT